MKTNADELIDLVMAQLKEAIENKNVEQMEILSKVYQRLCTVW